ncbi:MAG: hypothetical protein NTU76_01875, partial [Candidatus Taylorbacteria bacterium]|nr:hypothetical protein [Candidatus Taylorbacteria bacterium]
FKFLFKGGSDKTITFELKRKEGERKGEDFITYHTFKVLVQHWESMGDKKLISIDDIANVLQHIGFKEHRTGRKNITDLVSIIRTKIRSNHLNNNIILRYDRKLGGYFISIIQTQSLRNV